jgi:hypothetical protein
MGRRPRGDGLMTEIDVRGVIHHAINEFRGYDVSPLLEQLQANGKLATAVFDALKAREGFLS